ncbi:hypothetical protein F5Y04DRAFT_277077 [Hypomontagnella monticulosa]|nr:hypothetical protein F5Y04DRAFT_277077 [Hypomontagnella monticulosa]
MSDGFQPHNQDLRAQELESWWDFGLLPGVPSPQPSPSENYHGSPDNTANQSQDIPIEASCSVWITGLPPDCTIRQLLTHIRSAGKIFTSNISPADHENQTSAAKVVFWDRAGLDRFLNQYVWGTFVIRSYKPIVVMNRIRVAAQPPSERSRVIRIVGPFYIVNQQYLEQYFNKHFYYQLEDVAMIHSNPVIGRARIEFRFSSYRAQAASAVTWLHRARNERPDAIEGMTENEIAHWKNVRYFYGPDPCASA